MNIDDEILINQYGQDLVSINSIKEIFLELNIEDKRLFLKSIIYRFIQQSKAIEKDIEEAIKISNLKPTYTPCVMLKKGVSTSNLERIILLPENEIEKVLILLLSLFKIAYRRRFEKEKGSYKWWYWDLSDKNKIEEIKNNYEI